MQFLDRVLGKVSAEVGAGRDPLAAESADQAAKLRERIKKAVKKSDPGS